MSPCEDASYPYPMASSTEDMDEETRQRELFIGAHPIISSHHVHVCVPNANNCVQVLVQSEDVKYADKHISRSIHRISLAHFASLMTTEISDLVENNSLSTVVDHIVRAIHVDIDKDVIKLRLQSVKLYQTRKSSHGRNALIVYRCARVGQMDDDMWYLEFLAEIQEPFGLEIRAYLEPPTSQPPRYVGMFAAADVYPYFAIQAFKEGHFFKVVHTLSHCLLNAADSKRLCR